MIDAGAKAKTERGWLSVVEALDLVCDPNRSKADDARVRTITFADFAKEWTSGDLHTKHPDHVREKDSTRDKELLRLYIEPEIGHLPIDTVKLPHAERVMTSLPAELAPATRRQVAQCMRRVLGLAV